MKMRTLLAFALGLATTSILSAQQKVVLMEDFSSTTCVNCPAATAILNKVEAEQKARLIIVQYHLDIPGRNDPFFAENKTENLARADYYGGLNALPQVFIGGILTSGSNEGAVRSEVQSQLSSSASGVQIAATQTVSGAQKSVEVTVSLQNALPNGNRLYVAAVENMVHRDSAYLVNVAKSQPYNKETEFHNVFRKFLTPSAGVELNIGAGKSQKFTYNYTPETSWASDQMYVIAWVQDEFTHDVLQAGFSVRPNDPVSVESEEIYPGYDFATTAPNPASSQINLTYSLGNREDVALELYDIQGRLVRDVPVGRVEAGSHRYELRLDGLMQGIYTLRLRAGSYSSTQTISVVR